MDPTLSSKDLGENVDDTSLSYFPRSILFHFGNIYVSVAPNRNYWQKSELGSSCSMFFFFFPLETLVAFICFDLCPWY